MMMFFVRTPAVTKRLLCLALLAAMMGVPLLSTSGGAFAQPAVPPSYTPPDDYSSTGNLDEYAQFSQQGSDAFNKGQLTQAIEAFERALTVAPEPSLPVVYNNLAVVYIKRGNYFHDKLRQDQNALNDFRKAYFYLNSAWPEGAERKPLHEKNRQVAKENLNIAYRNLGINGSDKNKHLEMAKQLRLQGKFPEAIVEYELTLEVDKKDAVAAKALGDLFTVVNLPEKSKKYYALVVNDVASPGGAKAVAGISQADTLVQLGNAQYKTGEIDKAVVNFDKALTIDPTNVSALNMLEKIWQNEIKFNPNSVLGHANLGSVFQKKKQFEQAYQQYNAAEHFAEMDRNTPFEVKKMIRLNMGTLFQQQKDYQKALSAYNTVLQVDPRNLLASFYKATVFQESGNVDGAIQGYNQVLTIDPNYAPAQEKLLALIKQQSDPARLAAGLKQYADRFPGNATVQAQIGEEFHNRKDLDNAAFFYQRALKLDPKLAGTWANLGAIYQTQGKPDLSADAFQKAQALDPANETFKQLAQSARQGLGYEAYQQAVQLQQQGKSKEALPLFQKALSFDDTPEIHAAYGISLQSAGELDAAIAEYQKAMAQDAREPDYAYYLGTAYHQKKDLAKAQAAYQKALSLKPGYPEAKQALTSIEQQAASQDLEKAIEAYNQQRYPQALALVDQALAKNGKDAMAHYYKGLILDGQKKPSLAAQSYRQAIQYNPDFTDAYYALGVALDTARDTPGAKTAFERFLALSGSNEDDFVKYARERVKALP
ncbi:tetratricopeptide repeat protein [Vampirovibrio chlorellavorus]|uniref:tetratricopeptide repeat protein n=1 Tax=Vampirovibrio chlorellavorus TaxID=758823 RepID=UPI0026F2A50D|nr:tetratricopeptide repeat protein [Vampirovibrio chlorellavorus]